MGLRSLAAVSRSSPYRANAMVNLYNLMTSMPESGLLRALTDSKKKTWTYRGPIHRTNFRKEDVILEITRAAQNQESLHLVPNARNFPAADSILYDPEDSDVVLTCIQVTIKKNHPISVKGLQDIRGWLQGPTLKHIRPTKRRPWRFLFVVPSFMKSTFKRQQLDGDTDRGE